jgi:hypothetical protein
VSYIGVEIPTKDLLSPYMYGNILEFTGIFLADLEAAHKYDIKRTASIVSNDFKAKSEKFIDYIKSYNERYRKYDKIPTFYIDKDSWIRNINLNCWNCSLNFTRRPWFIPNGSAKKIIEGEEKVALLVYGIFCSPNCTINYLQSVYDKNIVNVETSKFTLYNIYQDVTGDKGVINPYPSFIILCNFRGPSGINAKDYRRHYV